MTKEEFEESEKQFLYANNRPPMEGDWTDEQIEYIKFSMGLDGRARLKRALIAQAGGKTIPKEKQKGCCGGSKKHWKQLLEEYKQAQKTQKTSPSELLV